MSYEYTVTIPSTLSARKRSQFRAMVREMGGSISKGKRMEEIPNATTLAAMQEVESGVELDTLDVMAFHAFAEAL